MINGELKSRIDQLWTAFWTGGITNPLTVIEQITFLMFSRLLDIVETRNEKRAARTGKPFDTIFTVDPAGTEEEKKIDPQTLRWSRYRHLPADDMLPFVRDRVFKHFKQIVTVGAESDAAHSTFKEYFKDAQLMIQKPTLLVQAVNMVESLPLTEGDTKGDLYEYLLSKLTTAGINGQFRTPRHIIRLMVEMLDPKPTETVADPACGTGGFLVGCMEFLLQKYSSPEGTYEAQVDGKTERVFTGDLLEPHWEHIRARMLNGFDFDATMLRIAAMNLLLHGVESPQIHYQDTLSASFTENFPDKAVNRFDVVLANPPFKGNLDEEDIHPSLLRMVKTRKTELLFIALILRLLKNGGRAAVIVPDGVLFGSSKAHTALRRALIEENQLEAVISLPSGVFKPYAGVSTAIIVFTKGGRTDQVWFYDVEADGWSLDDKRSALLPLEKLGPVPSCYSRESGNPVLTAEDHAKNNLPDILARWRCLSPSPLEGEGRGEGEMNRPRTAQSFCVPKADLAAQGYDLSLNRYKEVVHAEVAHRSPSEILKALGQLEAEIQQGMKELEGMLK
ncbi:MAG: SAM-dependent DNA methyltransferase [Gammaproteobacteria bacterium]|nr:SAM-dependent DNA methyltransferase [Gammaproteobacteria bacterium]